jgi:hypothetical protein
MQENANFAKEMTELKDALKEKINWNQVDLVMVGFFLLQKGICLNGCF